jgi:hypothetical protein
MTADRIDEIFGDLEHPFPGKRKPANRDLTTTKGRAGPQELELWDDHPRKMYYKGVETEFFTIRHVALAMNRSTRTIRTWERKEIIPPATHRAAKPHTSAIKQEGDRLWTRAQVEAMVTIAREERVLDGQPPGPRFTARLVRAFLALQKHPNSNS